MNEESSSPGENDLMDVEVDLDPSSPFPQHQHHNVQGAQHQQLQQAPPLMLGASLLGGERQHSHGFSDRPNERHHDRHSRGDQDRHHRSPDGGRARGDHSRHAAGAHQHHDGDRNRDRDRRDEHHDTQESGVQHQQLQQAPTSSEKNSEKNSHPPAAEDHTHATPFSGLDSFGVPKVQTPSPSPHKNTPSFFAPNDNYSSPHELRGGSLPPLAHSAVHAPAENAHPPERRSTARDRRSVLSAARATRTPGNMEIAAVNDAALLRTAAVSSSAVLGGFFSPGGTFAGGHRDRDRRDGHSRPPPPRHTTSSEESGHVRTSEESAPHSAVHAPPYYAVREGAENAHPPERRSTAYDDEEDNMHDHAQAPASSEESGVQHEGETPPLAQDPTSPEENSSENEKQSGSEQRNSSENEKENSSENGSEHSGSEQSDRLGTSLRREVPGWDEVELNKNTARTLIILPTRMIDEPTKRKPNEQRRKGGGAGRPRAGAGVKGPTSEQQKRDALRTVFSAVARGGGKNVRQSSVHVWVVGEKTEERTKKIGEVVPPGGCSVHWVGVGEGERIRELLLAFLETTCEEVGHTSSCSMRTGRGCSAGKDGARARR